MHPKPLPEGIKNLIYQIRDKAVMLDSDLAFLYEVTTGRLNEAVKRNIKRFPSDFMFQLSETEHQNLISQFAISSSSYGGRRKPPYVFTEQGVAMLSGILKSERAITVNIKIMRAFVHIRRMIGQNEALRLAIEGLEHRTDRNERDIQAALTFLKEILFPSEKEIPARPYKMGFIQDKRKT